MKKWIEIAGTCSRKRYEYLSDFLNKSGVENSVDFVECGMDEFPLLLKHAMDQYDFIRVGSPFGERVPHLIDQLPVTTYFQKSADSLFNEGGRWWARSMLTEGLIREVALVEKLDISESAFIIGAGASCRGVIAALMKIGFHKFNFTEKFEERGRLLLKELKETYFGVDFRFTPQSAITLLPGIHSIVVNTTPLVPSNDLLDELYYCNFLRPNGVVIDLTLVPPETPLLKAVKQVEGRIVFGFEVAALIDMYWSVQAFRQTFDQLAYSKGLFQICQSTTFDFSEFDIPDF